MLDAGICQACRGAVLIFACHQLMTSSRLPQVVGFENCGTLKGLTGPLLSTSAFYMRKRDTVAQTRGAERCGAHQVVKCIAQARVAQDPGVDVAGHGHLRAQQRVPQAHQHLLRQDPGPARSKEGLR